VVGVCVERIDFFGDVVVEHEVVLDQWLLEESA
jgi:hypothetical protein